MKSQVTRVTAATLLSVNEGASILANLLACDVDSEDLYNSLLSDENFRQELGQLLSLQPPAPRMHQDNADHSRTGA